MPKRKMVMIEDSKQIFEVTPSGDFIKMAKNEFIIINESIIYGK